MRIQHLIESRQNIFESIGVSDDPYFQRWEKEIHPLLIEVALSPDQIKQLFKSIETTASDQGSNRTLAGKAIDAAGQISDKVKDLWYNKLGSALAGSQPVKDFDAKWEAIKSKFASKHPDIAEKLSKYGEFANNNPKTHKFLLAIAGSLAAALGLAAVGGLSAGITATGLGVGGATAIINIADRLLQGQKASTAIGRGATAGIVAGLSAAGIKAASELVKATIMSFSKSTEVHRLIYNDKMVYLNPQDSEKLQQAGKSMMDAAKENIKNASIETFKSTVETPEGKAYWNLVKELTVKAADPEYQKQLLPAVQAAFDKNASLVSMVDAVKSLQDTVTPVVSAIAGQAAGAAGEKKESYYVQTRPLSEGQVYLLLRKISEQQQLDEGPMDWLKKGAAAVGKGVAAVGKQFTTNATYPKLLAAWKLEGSPTDSEELKKFLKDYGGITPEVIDKVYADMKLSGEPAPADDALPADDPRVKDLAKRSTEALQQWLEQAKRTGTMDPALIKAVEAELKKRKAAPPAAPGAPMPPKEIKSNIDRLNKDKRAELIADLKKELGIA
jgi:hypothetical protein